MLAHHVRSLSLFLGISVSIVMNNIGRMPVSKEVYNKTPTDFKRKVVSLGSDQPAMAAPCLRNLLKHAQIYAHQYQAHDTI